jgi:hypothetical protein
MSLHDLGLPVQLASQYGAEISANRQVDPSVTWLFIMGINLLSVRVTPGGTTSDLKYPEKARN